MREVELERPRFDIGEALEVDVGFVHGQECAVNDGHATGVLQTVAGDVEQDGLALAPHDGVERRTRAREVVGHRCRVIAADDDHDCAIAVADPARQLAGGDVVEAGPARDRQHVEVSRLEEPQARAIVRLDGLAIGLWTPKLGVQVENFDLDVVMPEVGVQGQEWQLHGHVTPHVVVGPD